MADTSDTNRKNIETILDMLVSTCRQITGKEVCYLPSPLPAKKYLIVETDSKTALLALRIDRTEDGYRLTLTPHNIDDDAFHRIAEIMSCR